MALTAMLAFSGSPLPAAQNVVQPLELEKLAQMLATQGRRSILVVMAAWCAPCIAELPVLNQLYQKYSSTGVAMMGISLDYGGPRAIQPLIDQHNVRFPIYWVGEKAIEPYNIRGIPLILFAENGKIIARILGKRSKKDLDQRFSDFLN
jgi:thiol-disulfide isomerase/thioredoxin